MKIVRLRTFLCGIGQGKKKAGIDNELVNR